MSGNDYLSIGGARGHTAVILGEVRMRVKMARKCIWAMRRFGVIAVDRVPSEAYSSHPKGVCHVQSVQEAICDMYDGSTSVCLKGVLGTKSQQSRIRVIVAVV